MQDLDASTENTLNSLSGEKLFELGVRHYEKKEYKMAVKMYSLAAEKKHAGAQNKLGFCYERGFGVDAADLNKAIEWYVRSGNNSDMAAQRNLGSIYRKKYESNSRDIESLKKSIFWYRKAANQGSPNAVYHMGRFHEKGFSGSDIPCDIQKAIEHYRRAAEKNEPEALYKLGLFYWVGTGVERDTVIALGFMSRAVKVNDKSAKEFLQKKYKTYLKHIEDNEKAGGKIDHVTGRAKLVFGYCYQYGIQFKQDLNAAIKCFREAAQISFEAQAYLAECYESGTLVEKDLKTSFEYYLLASSDKNQNFNKWPDFNFKLAQFYKEGINVVGGPDIKKAYIHCKKAVEKNEKAKQYLINDIFPELKKQVKKGSNDPDMHAYLAYCYDLKAQESKSKNNSLEFVKNGNNSINYYKSAAEMGSIEANFALGNYYASNVKHLKTEQDYELRQHAEKQIEKAADRYYLVYFKTKNANDKALIVSFFNAHEGSLKVIKSYLNEINTIEMSSMMRCFLINNPEKSTISKCYEILSWLSDTRLTQNNQNFELFIETEFNRIGEIFFDGARELLARENLTMLDRNAAIQFCYQIPDNSFYYPLALQMMLTFNLSTQEVSEIREKLYELNKKFVITSEDEELLSKKGFNIHEIFNQNAKTLGKEERNIMVMINTGTPSSGDSSSDSPAISPRGKIVRESDEDDEAEDDKDDSAENIISPANLLVKSMANNGGVLSTANNQSTNSSMGQPPTTTQNNLPTYGS